MIVIEKNILLNHTEISQKITRLAYQIYEDHHEYKILVVAGIKKRGFEVAKLLAAELEKISPIKIILTDIRIRKTDPAADAITIGIDVGAHADLPFIVVDDVANTGKTLMYALQPLLPHAVPSIKIAVLVQRSHRLFPIVPDYAGLLLATTLQENVHINFGADAQIEAYIN